MYKLASLLGGALKLKLALLLAAAAARKIPQAPWKSGFTTTERPPLPSPRHPDPDRKSLSSRHDR